jgi:hypothetical protein
MGKEDSFRVAREDQERNKDEVLHKAEEYATIGRGLDYDSGGIDDKTYVVMRHHGVSTFYRRICAV